MNFLDELKKIKLKDITSGNVSLFTLVTSAILIYSYFPDIVQQIRGNEYSIIGSSLDTTRVELMDFHDEFHIRDQNDKKFQREVYIMLDSILHRLEMIETQSRRNKRLSDLKDEELEELIDILDEGRPTINPVTIPFSGE